MSQSAAIAFESASSFFFSPLFTRQFSSTTTWPAAGATSRPSTQSRTTGTGWPSSSASRAATGASESASVSWPSVGRPRCDVTITRAPPSSATRIAPTEARMRVSSVMRPASSWGTLRSERISTRLPRTSRSVSRRMAMVSVWIGRLKRRGAAGAPHESVRHATSACREVLLPGAHRAVRANRWSRGSGPPPPAAASATVDRRGIGPGRRITSR